MKKESKSNIIEAMKWRYATKKFDSSKKIPPSELDELLSAIHLSPTSFGLFTWKALIVDNPETRRKIRESAWGQSQVTDASNLVVLLARTSLNESDVEEYVSLISKTRNIPKESLNNYKDMMNSHIKGLSHQSLVEWTKKQAYIALGTLLSFSALKKIDSCPMEGFDSKSVDQILGIEGKGWTTAVMCPVGYRADDDGYSKLPKVRFPFKEVIQSR